MRLAVAVPAALALSLAAGAARADGVYFSEGVGAGSIHDRFADYADGTVRIRFALGLRSGDWALETFLAPEFGFRNPDVADQPVMLGYGIDVKRLVRVSRHVSLYARGSVSRLTVEDDPQQCCVLYPTNYYPSIFDPSLTGYSGRGLGFGVGAQIKGKVSALGLLFWPLFFSHYGPKIDAGLYLEDGYDFYRLHGLNGGSVDAGMTRWTFGLAFGSDF